MSRSKKAAENIKQRLLKQSSNYKIAVVGIGRVGLPLSLAFASKGHTVYGIDINQDLLATLREGQMPFKEDDGNGLLQKTLDKTFFPTDDFFVIKDADYIVMVLGTSIDENMNPVFRDIEAALEKASKFFKPGQTLILRSTVSPEIVHYLNAYIAKFKNIKLGNNFFLAFCPERIAEGKGLTELFEIPQLVGADDDEAIDRAVKLFSTLGIKCYTSDTITVELAKIFSNMYRYISFAIPNEFMTIAERYDRNIFEIIDLVNKDYKRGGLKMPGLTAGPCLFKDGFFLTYGQPDIGLITTAWKVNESIPAFIVNRLKEKTDLIGKKVVILGMAFKAEIDDPRDSLSKSAKNAFVREGADVSIHDPHINAYKGDVYDMLEGADVIFIATNHDWYKKMDLKKLKDSAKKKAWVCDVWNIFGNNSLIYSIDKLS